MTILNSKRNHVFHKQNTISKALKALGEGQPVSYPQCAWALWGHCKCSCWATKGIYSSFIDFSLFCGYLVGTYMLLLLFVLLCSTRDWIQGPLIVRQFSSTELLLNQRDKRQWFGLGTLLSKCSFGSAEPAFIGSSYNYTLVSIPGLDEGLRILLN